MITDILAYSAMEQCELDECAAAIAAACGGLRLRVERMSTTTLLDRLLREGANGRWDVIFGWALTTMRDPRLQTWFAPLALPEVTNLPQTARDPAGRWFCPSAFVPAFCLNEERLAARGLPTPHGWADLADPRFRGELVLPDPNYSGAGFLHLTALLQAGATHEPWSLLQRVARNNPRIERTAFAPCTAAADGVAAVGVTVTIAAERMSQLGRAVHFVIPNDAAGVEPEGFALRQNSPRAGQALCALAWTLTPAAKAIYTKYRKMGLMPFAADGGALPKSLFAVDVEQAIASRVEMLHQWTQIFQENIEPKQQT